MVDKLLVEIDIEDGNAEDAVPALVYLANELADDSTMEITEAPKWRERIKGNYQLKWRFAEDAQSCWQLNIGVELALQINDALRVAQSALNAGKQRKDTSNLALEAIVKAQTDLISFIHCTDPQLCSLIAE